MKVVGWDVPAMKATFKEIKFYASERGKATEPKDCRYQSEFDSKAFRTDSSMKARSLEPAALS